MSYDTIEDADHLAMEITRATLRASKAEAAHAAALEANETLRSTCGEHLVVLDRWRTEAIALTSRLTATTLRAEKTEDKLARLSAPRPAPRCPKCESHQIHLLRESDGSQRLVCAGCGYNEAATSLDAWRPKP